MPLGLQTPNQTCYSEVLHSLMIVDIRDRICVSDLWLWVSSSYSKPFNGQLPVYMASETLWTWEVPKSLMATAGQQVKRYHWRCCNSPCLYSSLLQILCNLALNALSLTAKLHYLAIFHVLTVCSQSVGAPQMCCSLSRNMMIYLSLPVILSEPWLPSLLASFIINVLRNARKSDWVITERW